MGKALFDGHSSTLNSEPPGGAPFAIHQRNPAIVWPDLDWWVAESDTLTLQQRALAPVGFLTVKDRTRTGWQRVLSTAPEKSPIRPRSRVDSALLMSGSGPTATSPVHSFYAAQCRRTQRELLRTGSLESPFPHVTRLAVFKNA
jgi:hypothetical protein